jgi:hypothetical protein
MREQEAFFADEAADDLSLTLDEPAVDEGEVLA